TEGRQAGGRQAGGRQTLSLLGHTGPVFGVVFSPDGKRLASAGGVWDAEEKDYLSGEVKVWDALTGQPRLALQGNTGAVWSVAFGPDGRHLASGSEDQTVQVWDLQRGGQQYVTLQEHADAITSVAFSPDGRHLASGSGDHSVKVWDVGTGRQTLSLK